MSNLPVLKKGALCYYDSTFSGLVPAKVLSVSKPKTPPPLDFIKGSGRTSIKVEIEVTEDHRCYKKGEIIKTNSINAVPRKAIKRHNYSTTVGPYTVEPDSEYDNA